MPISNSLDDHPNDTGKLWQWAAQQLERVYLPSLTDDKLAELKQCLPEREAQEPVEHWLQRCQAHLQKPQHWETWKRIMGSNNLVELTEKPAEVVAQFIRLAAASHTEAYPLPDPNTPIESNDGVFSLFITATDHNSIRLKLQVRGLEAQNYANQPLGIRGLEAQQLLARIQLDAYASGEAELQNLDSVREALLAFEIIKLIQT